MKSLYIGIGIGAFVLIVAVLAIIYYYMYRCSSKKSTTDTATWSGKIGACVPETCVTGYNMYSGKCLQINNEKTLDIVSNLLVKFEPFS